MTLREILEKHGFRFNKRFGQNFLTDGNLLTGIADCSGVTADDTVVEIGVGAGTLTRVTAARAKRVIGYEIDKNLRPVLAETLSGVDNAEIVFEDFMRVPIGELEAEIGGEYVVIANLPYYITTPVLMKLIEEAALCKRLVVMVQEEVALRLTAKENTAEYGSITASIDICADAKIVKKVSRKMFYPVPNVDSAVVRIDVCPPKYGVEDVAFYRKVVRAAFSNRRKTLVNDLILSFGIPRETAEKAVASAGLDLRARGETLSTVQFVRLSSVLRKVL